MQLRHTLLASGSSKSKIKERNYDGKKEEICDLNESIKDDIYVFVSSCMFGVGSLYAS